LPNKSGNFHITRATTKITIIQTQTFLLMCIREQPDNLADAHNVRQNQTEARSLPANNYTMNGESVGVDILQNKNPAMAAGGGRVVFHAPMRRGVFE
jgi:hypothetical protein